MMSFLLKGSLLSTCAGVLLLASSSTPLAAMTNEDAVPGDSAAATTVKQARPLSEDEKLRLQAFKERMNAKLAERDDMLLMRLGWYFNSPDIQQTQRTEDILPYLVLGEKLIEDQFFQRITSTQWGGVPLDQDRTLEKATLLTYLTILSKFDTLLTPRAANEGFPGRYVMAYLVDMTVGQIEACERNAEALYLRESQAHEIYERLFSKSPEDIDRTAKLFEKHRMTLFLRADAYRTYQAHVLKELIRLPLSYLEKRIPTFFSKEMLLADRVRVVKEKVSRVQRLFRKRTKKREIRDQRTSMTN